MIKKLFFKILFEEEVEKKLIKHNENVLFAMKSYLNRHIADLENGFTACLKLQNMSDEEIIKEYKHTKFSEISILERKFLEQKYNFHYCSFTSVNDTLNSVYPFSYISDSIKQKKIYNDSITRKYKLSIEDLRGID